MADLGIYVHVPFCRRKCVYCDFASFAGCEDRADAYFEALGQEIDSRAEALRAREVRSVFFGGGTPSLVDAGHIEGVMARLARHARFAPDCEVTIEANPGTVDAQKLDIYRRCGVNRISFGVQSFDAGLLETLGRIHSPDEAREAVRLARAAGFDNISIDLMYALPGQSMAQWQATLAEAVALPVTHISAYSLIVEPGTEMARRVEAGEVVPADDDAVNEQQRMANVLLAQGGFERYEISNYARGGLYSRHNMRYWTGGDYLGLGSAAHSLMEGERFENPASLTAYLSGQRGIERTRLTAEDMRTEALMLETRTTRGLDLNRWRARFGEDFEATHARKLARLSAYGLIEIEGGFLRLTEPGLELQDSVVLELTDGI